VLARALEKDPAKRFATVMELARAVDAIYGGPRPDAATSPDAPPVRPVDPKTPAADTVVDRRLPLPRVVKPLPSRLAGSATFRDKLAELARGFILSPFVCAACTAPWALLQTATPWELLGRIFLVATVLTWMLTIVGRMPRRDDNNPWGRRAVQLLVGVGVGSLAFWLDGWGLPTGTATATSHDLVLWGGHRVSPAAMSVGLRYLFYFGLAIAACRWWIASDRNRRERMRLLPVFAAAFWGGVFAFLWPWESAPVVLGLAPMVIAAVAVQAVSPWNEKEKRKR
jgi:hypothetical protein